MVEILHGDSIELMRGMGKNRFDAIITDPPYGLEFSGGSTEWMAGGKMARVGFGRDVPWPSFSSAGLFGAANPTCDACGGRMRGVKKCSCDEPQWRIKGVLQGRADVSSGFAKGGSDRFKDSPDLPAYGKAGAQNRLCKTCGGSERGQDRKGFKKCVCDSPSFPPRDFAKPGQLIQQWHESWAREALRVIKPGGHMLVFSGSRVHPRLGCALEDAGWEIRDSLFYLYSSGFPKSTDMGRVTGDPTYDGWSTTLKPACEPIILVRKPIDRTVAENLKRFRTGALNIDGCRVNGRWPSNVLLDGSPAVQAVFPNLSNGEHASRAFYTSKPSRKEKEAGCEHLTTEEGRTNPHPTVKPVDLMEYLIRLTTPVGGTLLDPFCGSGTTLVAAERLGFNVVGVEREQKYVEVAKARVAACPKPLDLGGW